MPAESANTCLMLNKRIPQQTEHTGNWCNVFS